MRVWVAALAIATCIASGTSAGENKPLSENCGWLIATGVGLAAQPDAALKPSDPKPLPAPPTQTRAAYCDRDTMMTYVGDERLIKLGLPLIIRSGGREGVLEYPPQVVFNYHPNGDHYDPGKATGRP